MRGALLPFTGTLMVFQYQHKRMSAPHSRSATLYLSSFLVITSALSVGGCASRAYVAPVDGPHASIKYRLVSPVPEASAFALVDGQCAQRKWMGGLKSDPSPSDKLQRELSATIPAGSPFRTEVSLDVSNATYCGVSWEFHPENNASYEADVSYADKKCDVKLYRLEAVAGGTPRRMELPSPPFSCK